MPIDHHSRQEQDPASRAVYRWNEDSIDTPAERLAELLAPELAGLPVGRIAEAVHRLHVDGKLSEFTGDQDPAEIVAHIVQLFGEFSQSAAIIARCIALVRGLGTFEEVTETAIAERYGLGRATICAIVGKLRERLKIDHCAGLRGEKVRSMCARRQTGRRARQAPLPWAFSDCLTAAITGPRSHYSV